MDGSVGDARHMVRALQLARLGQNTADPNPRVGCVLVREGVVVGEGWHRRAGEAHAEVHALAAAGTRAQGATCYVTLEPCAHTGRTAPCADALVAAGVKRVVVGMEDPNPLVHGQGIARLRAAGIAVDTDVLRTEAEALNPGFLQRMRAHRPWVRVKLAGTLDGRSATAAGESQWITSAAARQDVQQNRARASAILTGVATVIADNPRLTVRPEPERIPLRIIVDSGLRTPPGSALFAHPGPVLIATTRAASAAAGQLLMDTGAELLRLPSDGTRVALPALLSALALRGVNEVWTEAGPTLAGALLAAGLADELVMYLAPRLLGDAGRGMFALPAIHRLGQALSLRMVDIRVVGSDLRITAVPVPLEGT